MFPFDINKVITSEKIDAGAFGKVFPYRSINDPNDKQWVVKRINPPDFETILKIMEEVVLGFRLDHPAILPIAGYYPYKNKEKECFEIYIKLPRMEKSFRKVITEKKERFPEHEIIRVLSKLVSGLEYLHQKGIAHRDIKPENVMLNKQRNIKLIDFGTAKYIAADELSEKLRPEERNIGTRLYMAPELENNSYNLLNKDLFLTDVWGLGLTIAELCILDPNSTFYEKSKDTLFKSVRPLLVKYTTPLIDLIVKMITPNPAQRISLQDIQKALETNFAKILQEIAQEEQMPEQEEQKLEENEELKNKIARIQTEVQQKLDNNFEFIPDKLFAVKGNPVRTKDRDIESLILNLKHSFQGNDLDNLPFFALDLSQCVQITDDSVGKLGSYIKEELKHLQHLELNFENCYELKKDGISELITNLALARMQDLYNLTLNLNECNNICDDAIEAIARNLADMKNIKQLRLSFQNCHKVTPEAFHKLELTLKDKLQNLHSLELDVQKCLPGLQEAVKYSSLFRNNRKNFELKIIIDEPSQGEECNNCINTNA